MGTEGAGGALERKGEYTGMGRLEVKGLCRVVAGAAAMLVLSLLLAR